MTRIAATSDFHGTFPPPGSIPPCDILVIAGDIGANYVETNLWLRSLPSECEVVAVMGNADWLLRSDAWLLPWTSLVDDAAIVDGVSFYGASGEWVAKGIPTDTQVLVTHVPPHGILDEVTPGEHIGSKWIRDKALEADGLMLHLFGHCHEQAGRTHQQEGVTFANCGYLGRHLPQVFEI